MPEIIWSSPAVTLHLTGIACGIMMGLAIEPWIDRLRHLDKKKAPRGRQSHKGAKEIYSHIVWHGKGKKSNES